MTESNSNMELPLQESEQGVSRVTVNHEQVGSIPTPAARRAEDLVVFMGLADILGIESFIPFDEMKPHMYQVLDMRMKLNSHRAPVFYRVFLSKKDSEIVQFLCSGSEHKKALEHLKATALEIQVARPLGQKEWDAIPTYTKDELIRKPPSNSIDVRQMEFELEEDDVSI